MKDKRVESHLSTVSFSNSTWDSNAGALVTHPKSTNAAYIFLFMAK